MRRWPQCARAAVTVKHRVELLVKLSPGLFRRTMPRDVNWEGTDQL
jgi:hypothetical protein